MRHTLLISLLLINITLFSQKTKSYYININGKQVFKKEATFKRFVTKQGDTYRVKDEYLNGTIFQTGSYSDKFLKTKTDTFQTYYINGNPSNETVYKNGEKDGHIKDYFVSGQIKKQGFYINGKEAGQWIWLNNSGDTLYSINNATYSEVYGFERPPFFKGGQKKWTKYWESMGMVNHLNYDNAQAIVYYTFKIEESGEISNIEMILHGTYEMDSTLIKHLEKMPNWFPAIEKGKTINKTVLESYRWAFAFNKEVEVKDKILAKALYKSAINSFKKKDFTTALEKFNYAIKYNPNNTEYYFNLALCYYQLGKIDLACEYWNIVNILNPKKITKDIQTVCKNKF